ncbi:MAG: hypothetical protein U5K56_02860 [Halioglobus sp.]|nr:hypothetical protein [Halioglobus sp.]
MSGIDPGDCDEGMQSLLWTTGYEYSIFCLTLLSNLNVDGAMFENRYLRVITLEDKITIHNAFPDRGFEP